MSKVTTETLNAVDVRIGNVLRELAALKTFFSDESENLTFDGLMGYGGQIDDIELAARSVTSVIDSRIKKGEHSP